ncbi:MAG: insulinase family protein, partial [Candidatus Edwardsbacteria bacterium]|nr:insulinase family protein [Candidatus Edwardsbacteria bacterium]
MPVSYHRTVLKNGLTVVSEKIPYTHSVAVGFWLAHGSRDETPENNGISHLIEHLSFKGTTSRSARDIALSMESIGGHLDAFT